MNDLFRKTPAEAAITVTELNRRVKGLLEQGLAKLWIEGEISNLARPASGHVYFSLKDKNAQIRAAFFRQRQRGPTIGFKNGDHVLAFGRVSLYEPRGDYQLIVERLEPAGEGALKREFDRLKLKLSEEGLFAEELKQPIPEMPTRIGVITSPSGAALHDILTVLKRRFPMIPVVIYPAAVQGDAAPAELVAALESAQSRAECDVLIIGRGGGSLEDLWAFNSEGLARAIADSTIPIVSAVGHETDVTIADFVADRRAPTPSGAAEIVAPDARDWLRSFQALEGRVGRLAERAVEDVSQRLDWLTRHLVQQSPAATLERQAQTLGELRGRLSGAMQSQIKDLRAEIGRHETDLFRQSPAVRVQRAVSRLAQLTDGLRHGIETLVEARKHRLSLGARALDAVSPLATLGRGYAIVSDSKSGKVVTDASKLAPGAAIEARVARGRLSATVDEVLADEDGS